MMFIIVIIFFFSSRRRHTRFDCDWSSDVCSSDLIAIVIHSIYNHLLVFPALAPMLMLIALPVVVAAVFERSERATREWVGAGLDLRSEERRVGKECRTRWRKDCELRN